ncbi:MAG: penicillin-binding protein activator [Alphaproteobacteria bacterium]
MPQFLICLLAVIAVSLSGCQSPRKQDSARAPITTTPQARAPVYDNKAPKRTHKVALLLPLTGRSSGLGQAMLQSAQMSLFDNPDSGLELMVRDTQGNPQVAAQAATDAINQGAQLILGPLFANAAQSVAATAQMRNIPVLSFSNNSSISGPTLFTMGFAPRDQIQVLLETAASHGMTRIGALVPKSSYGDVIRGELERHARAMGISLDLVMGYQPGTSDFTQQATTISTSGIDALIIPEGGQQLRLMVSSLVYHNVNLNNVRLLGTGQWDTNDVFEEPLLQKGWYVAAPRDQRQKFEQRYRQQYHLAPPRLATLPYDAISLAALLARTNANAGMNPFDTRFLTQERGFTGIDGMFRLHRDGSVQRGLTVLEVGPGRLKTIAPPPRGF